MKKKVNEIPLYIVFLICAILQLFSLLSQIKLNKESKNQNSKLITNEDLEEKI
jgi:amino acid permease